MAKARLVVILCILAFGGLWSTQVEAAERPRTNQEQYVLRQVAAGQVADLKARFGEKEENRRLAARFVEDLLIGAFETRRHRRGIRIKNAIIREPLDLKSADVSCEVELEDCEFREDVNFQDSLFEKNLRLDGCLFAEEAHFLKMTVKKSAYFEEAIFKGPVNFNGINIDGSINMQFTKFKSEDNTVYFNSSKILKSAYFIGAKFSGPLQFRRAFVGEELNFGAALEGARLKEVDFNGTTIEFYFSLRDTTITGPAKFVGLRVGWTFIWRRPGSLPLSLPEPKSGGV
jgi:hypothetical protein